MTAALPSLSPAVLSTCRTYWRRGPRGRGTAPDCCKGCPLMGPCFTPAGPSREGLVAHTEALNRAAEKVGGAA